MKVSKLVEPSRSPLEQKVSKIISDVLCVDEEAITPEASFVKDLGADSLDRIELAMAFEEEFGIAIDDAEWETLTSAGTVDTLAGVLALLAKKRVTA